MKLTLMGGFNRFIKIAARNISENIGKLLPFSFMVEVFDSNNTSVISIMSNEQKLTTDMLTVL